MRTTFSSPMGTTSVELASLDASHHCVRVDFFEHIPNRFAGPHAVCAHGRMSDKFPNVDVRDFETSQSLTGVSHSLDPNTQAFCS